MLFLAGPLSILYGISIGIAYLITVRREGGGTDAEPNEPAEAPSPETPPPGPVGPVVSESALEEFNEDEVHDHEKGASESAGGVEQGKPSREDLSTYERSVVDRQLSMPFRAADPVTPDADVSVEGNEVDDSDDDQ